MALWDLGMNHIVDVDGQLLAIDAEVIDTGSLLAKASKPRDSQVWLVRAGERMLLQARQLVRLNRDEVLFFETAEVRLAWAPDRLAA